MGDDWLTINWGYAVGGSVAAVISSVQTGGFAASQTVNYTYAVTGNALTLRTAEYEAPSAQYPQGIRAGYIYENSLLIEADDPHFAGAMTRIRYKYRMERCLQYPVSDPPDAHFYYIYAQGEALAEEQSPYNDASGNPIVVSRFAIHCWDGTRTEWNGFGSWRKFFYGHSAIWPGSGSRGHELALVTDFSLTGTNVPSVRQSHLNGDPFQLWDARGIMTQLEYGDGTGLPRTVRHVGSDNSFRIYDRIDPNPAARDTLRIHNPYNYLLYSQTDERNHKTTYTRDARRRITRIDYPEGSFEEFGPYNEFNQYERHRLASGAIEMFHYDGRGRLEWEYNSVDGWDARKAYTYDDLDRVRTMQDGRARAAGKDFTVRMTYNCRHQVIREEYPATNGRANPVKAYGYDAYGNCTSITNELGHTSLYEYDSYRRCTAYIEPLNAPAWNGSGTVASRRWDWIYDRWIDNLGQRAASAHTKNEWRIQIEPAFNTAGERRMTARAHDLQNRIVVEQTGWIQRPTQIGDWYWSGDTESHSFIYDENGQKSSYTDSRGRLTTYEYDLRNRLWKTNETVNSVPRTTETLYDATGNKTLVRFPDGQTQQWPDYAYDAFGQPRIFIDERGNTTNMDYWPWGPMKKLAQVTTHRIKDGGGMEDQLTAFFPDLLGRPWRTYFPDSSYEENTYEFGQLKTWKTRKHQTKTIVYDARGREESHSWNDGVTPGVSRDWDAASRLTTISNPVSTIEYIYDAAGQVREEYNNIAGSGARVRIIYHRYPNGAAALVTYPNGFKVRRDYTARGQLAAVDYPDARGNVVLQFVRYQYLADGKVAQQNYFNGVESRFDYDDRGMTRVVHHRRVSPWLETYTWRYYWRDERDRITAFQKGTDNSGNPMENGHGDRFRYDEQGQLKEAWYNAAEPENSGAGNSRYDGFNYDELGNRMGANFLANHGPMTFTRKDNGLNQYRGWWNFSITNYDDDIAGWGAPGTANGVLMQDGNMTAGFNALNQPMMIWSEATSPGWMFFGYDPPGRCVKRWVAALDSGSVPPADSNPATYFYYEGWNMLSEGQAGLPTERIYVHGNRVDEIVCDFYYPDGQWRYHHYDARGHSILLTGPNGHLIEQYEYDAFGHPYFYDSIAQPLNSSTFGNRFLFTGREWLSELKLYDYRNRLYQPELGRFLQPDPKHFAAGDYNLYRYCHNDPINKSDPFGLEFFDHDFQEVSRVPGEPSLDGLTTPQLELSIVMVPSSGGFSLQSKVDVRITSKYIATTKPSGQPRDRGAIKQTKVHENTHRDVAKKWHDANQNKVPKGPFKTSEAATKVAQEAGNKIKADFDRTLENDKQHKPDSLWKKILEKDR